MARGIDTGDNKGKEKRGEGGGVGKEGTHGGPNSQNKGTEK